MTRCDLRSYGECDCPAGICQQEPARTAPVITFTAKEQFFAMAMLALFMTAISYAALSRAERVIKIQDQDNQEAYAHVNRR
ncbi:hypothetical protein FHT86_002187 [Rhizobium sp. BK313]|uniref:hypothetical protein n=1 Tax=Rhizobium sp. BK313 TaxID=2587081 RepID=UPI00161260DD|nr:hypothetical protein [Rhizobium sp. BK313]MBB3453931.1 hypothetical protein [Rhizobium sp. BK313]